MRLHKIRFVPSMVMRIEGAKQREKQYDVAVRGEVVKGGKEKYKDKKGGEM